MTTRTMNQSASMTISSPAHMSSAVVSFAFTNAVRFFSALRFYFYYYFFNIFRSSERSKSC